MLLYFKHNSLLLLITFIFVTATFLDSAFAGTKKGSNNIVLIKGAPSGNGDRVGEMALCPNGQKIIYMTNNVFRSGRFYFEYDVQTGKSKPLFSTRKKNIFYSEFVYSNDCSMYSFATNAEGITSDNPRSTYDNFIYNTIDKSYFRIPVSENSRTYISAILDNKEEVLLHSASHQLFPELQDLEAAYAIYHYKTGTSRIIAKDLKGTLSISNDGRYVYYSRGYFTDYFSFDVASVFDDQGSLIKLITNLDPAIMRIDRLTGEVVETDYLGDDFGSTLDFLGFSESDIAVRVSPLQGSNDQCTLKTYNFSNGEQHEISPFACVFFGSVTTNGRYLIFTVRNGGLFAGVNVKNIDVFRLDLSDYTIKHINAPLFGKRGSKTAGAFATPDATGTTILFSSIQNNLVRGDTTVFDLFLYRD